MNWHSSNCKTGQCFLTLEDFGFVLFLAPLLRRNFVGPGDFNVRVEPPLRTFVSRK
jgi:hypothetical protein